MLFGFFFDMEQIDSNPLMDNFGWQDHDWIPAHEITIPKLHCAYCGCKQSLILSSWLRHFVRPRLRYIEEPQKSSYYYYYLHSNIEELEPRSNKNKNGLLSIYTHTPKQIHKYKHNSWQHLIEGAAAGHSTANHLTYSRTDGSSPSISIFGATASFGTPC